MDYGHETQLVALAEGCVKLQRQAVACVTISFSLRLNLQLILKKNLIYVYGAWWLYTNRIDSNIWLILHSLTAQFYLLDDVSRSLGSFTTGCVKLQLPSLRRNAWCHNGGKYAISLIFFRFWAYFVLHMFDAKLFNHVIIGSEHGWG